MIFYMLCGVWADGLDGPEARAFFAKEVGALFGKDDFAAIERMGNELRTKKTRFREGSWKLAHFYAGLSLGDASIEATHDEAEWRRWFARMDAWEKAFPDSITLPPARAVALTDYAWEARGGGWGNSVTEAGAKHFGERLAQARAVLEKAAKLPVRCPHWYRAMQAVALGQGWDREEYERLFADAVAVEPDYTEFYFSKALYLMPRWHGEPGEWERFAEESARRTAEIGGMGMYTRIARINSGYYGKLFKETRIEWAKMKQGFLDLEKRWPDSPWILNNFCKYAAEAGDKETVAALLKRIGDKPMMNAWETVGRFELARRMAAPGQAGKPHERATLSPPGDDAGRAFSVAFSPDGGQLAGGFESGAVVVWDLATGKPLWQPEPLEGPVFTLAFSPDGKLLAAGLGEEGIASRGSVTVWDTVSRKPRTMVEGWAGIVSTVRFAPDGKTLLMVGGLWNKRTEARLMDVASGTVQSLDKIIKGTRSLSTAAISPDGGLLAVDCMRSIKAWEFPEKKVVFQPKQTLRGAVHALDFSPDGKMLAAGLYTGWNSPGAVTLWDLPGFKERKPGIQTPTNGILTIAFSPDSTLLIGGGQDQCVRVWQAATGREIATLFGHEKLIQKVAVSPDGKTIASASFDGTVKLWDMPAGPGEAR